MIMRGETDFTITTENQTAICKATSWNLCKTIMLYLYILLVRLIYKTLPYVKWAPLYFEFD